MSTLTPVQIAGLVKRHTGDDRKVATAVAVALGESGGRTDARATNRTITGRTNTDRGLWQISSIWHPGVSDATADDPAAATAYAARISRGFTDMSPWVAYSSGAYRSHLPAAEAAVRAAGKPGAVDSAVGGVVGAVGGGAVLGLPGAVLGGLAGQGNGVTAIGGGVIDAAGGALKGIDAVGAFAAALTDRGTWVRVVYVVAGLGAAVMGALILNRDAVSTAANVAADFVPVGRAAKAAGAVAGK